MSKLRPSESKSHGNIEWMKEWRIWQYALFWWPRHGQSNRWKKTSLNYARVAHSAFSLFFYFYVLALLWWWSGTKHCLGYRLTSLASREKTCNKHEIHEIHDIHDNHEQSRQRKREFINNRWHLGYCPNTKLGSWCHTPPCLWSAHLQQQTLA